MIWVTIAAIIVAPITALWVSGKITETNRRKANREKALKNLIQHRDNIYHSDRIEAINAIPIEFSDCSNVLEAWNTYYENFLLPVVYPEKCKTEKEIKDYCVIQHMHTLHTIKQNNDLTELLYLMGKALKYKHGRAFYSRKPYHPQGLIDWQQSEAEKQKKILELLEGNRSVRVIIDTDNKKK